MSAAPLVLTRPILQAAAWAQPLQALGVQVRVRPLIDIESDVDGIAAAVRALPLADAAFVTSPAAVQALQGTVWPAQVLAACVGPGTAAALRAHGVAQVLCPSSQAEQFDSEALWPVLEAAGPWRGRRWLWLRGDGGREWLMERLREEGADIAAFTVYHRRIPALEPEVLARELAQRALWLFSSSEALDNLQHLLPMARLDDVQALATHPRIAQRAAGMGMHVQVVRPELEAVAAAWRRWVAP